MKGKNQAVVLFRELLKILGKENIRGVLNGELTVTEKSLWKYDLRGDIVFCVRSARELAGEQWIGELQKQFRLDTGSKEFLLSSDLAPVPRTRVIVLKSTHFGVKTKVGTILDFATSRGYVPLESEHACLIRQKFTDEQLSRMGLGSIVVITTPPSREFLEIDSGSGGGWLTTSFAGRELLCSDDEGFAFEWPVR